MIRTLGALAVLMALAVTGPLACGGEAPAAWRGPTHPMNVIQDKGTFTYYVNEEVVGTSQSEWREDGSFRNKATVTLAGQTFGLSVNLEVDKEGFWTSIAMDTARGPARIARTGSSARIEIGGETHRFEIKPGSLLMEDMSPALMSQAILAYDHTKGGRTSWCTRRRR